MGLKHVSTFSVALLASLGLVAATSLVVLTIYLHRTTLSMQAAVEGIQSAEDFEVTLLNLHGLEGARRRGEPLSLGTLTRAEQHLASQLERSREQAQSGEERRLLTHVDQDVARYLELERRNREVHSAGQMTLELNRQLESTLLAINQLITLNIQEARDDQFRVERWDELGGMAGMGVAVLLVAGVVVLLVWMRRSVYRPLLGISHAMRHFAVEGPLIKAPEDGVLELRDMACTFNQMSATLQQQHEARLAFLAGVAHDLRNPLSALRMSATLATSSRGPLSEERLQKTMALVRRQVSRLDRMVGDLLDATRIEAGHFELKLESRDAGELAAAVVELYQSGESERELRLRVRDAPLMVRCDFLRLEQVLNNLVSNALKYSSEGSGVEVEARREGEEIWLSVKDCGIGISPEELQQLFTPFQRTGRAREKAPGVGIGLSVARRIVEAHGGQIEVESAPGQGSTFRVRLPRAPP